ncbi:MAG: hypothetical protein CM15mP18_1020 [Methanobacteriota archaeon]|nr:MAG: hypothetical protein CM15mP18_1020 [Euryarchaeota archaeon]
MLRSTLFSSAIWAKAAEGEVDVLDCGEGLGLRFWALHLWQRTSQICSHAVHTAWACGCKLVS